jgi:hypothetical protein
LHLDRVARPAVKIEVGSNRQLCHGARDKRQSGNGVRLIAYGRYALENQAGWGSRVRQLRIDGQRLQSTLPKRTEP